MNGFTEPVIMGCELWKFNEGAMTLLSSRQFVKERRSLNYFRLKERGWTNPVGLGILLKTMA